jgi:predicted neuraminidase
LFVAGKETFLFFSAVRPEISIYFRRSSDSGQTWSEPVHLGEAEHTTRSNGICLATGELLVPLHERGTKAGGVLKSKDGGKTWTRFGKVANPEGQGGEPSIAEVKSGKVHMMLRTKDGELWRSISSDKGETWSAPEKTGLTATASASHLLCARDGTLVLTRNPSRERVRFPLVICTSRDEGRTWTEPVALADRPTDEPGWAICYPTLVELPDSTLRAVWTEILKVPGMRYGDIYSAKITLSKP